MGERNQKACAARGKRTCPPPRQWRLASVGLGEGKRTRWKYCRLDCANEKLRNFIRVRMVK